MPGVRQHFTPHSIDARILLLLFENFALCEKPSALMRHTISRQPAPLQPPNSDAGDNMAGIGATGTTGTTVNRDSTASHRCVMSACDGSRRSADAVPPATEGGTAETTTRVRFRVLMICSTSASFCSANPPSSLRS